MIGNSARNFISYVIKNADGIFPRAAIFSVVIFSVVASDVLGMAAGYLFIVVAVKFQPKYHVKMPL